MLRSLSFLQDGGGVGGDGGGKVLQRAEMEGCGRQTWRRKVGWVRMAPWPALQESDMEEEEEERMEGGREPVSRHVSRPMHTGVAEHQC